MNAKELKKKLEDETGWKWDGMLYRPNGDGYARFVNPLTGEKKRVGAAEVMWDSRKGSFKQAAIYAFMSRFKS